MIHLDTNYLIRALIPGTLESLQVQGWLLAGEAVSFSSIVWTEFLCGPVDPAQTAAISTLFPIPEPFNANDAHIAARLFNGSGRRRGTLVDCMIASIAIRKGATLATNNVADFSRMAPLGLDVISNP
jgi:predicted nucleic acid-binding protein